jgi:hypothetical protein
MNKSHVDVSFSDAEHLVKHSHLSRQAVLLQSTVPPESADKHETRSSLSSSSSSSTRAVASDRPVSIHERLYTNFTDTCPLFLLKEGIDHRFEFLDFAPDLDVRRQFHPIEPRTHVSDNEHEPTDGNGNGSRTHLSFVTTTTTTSVQVE